MHEQSDDLTDNLVLPTTKSSIRYRKIEIVFGYETDRRSSDHRETYQHPDKKCSDVTSTLFSFSNHSSRDIIPHSTQDLQMTEIITLI
jgi:hypothetical protein